VSADYAPVKRWLRWADGDSSERLVTVRLLAGDSSSHAGTQAAAVRELSVRLLPAGCARVWGGDVTVVSQVRLARPSDAH
jgi:hypothetical protein